MAIEMAAALNAKERLRHKPSCFVEPVRIDITPLKIGMSVKEAQELGVCRICGQKVSGKKSRAIKPGNPLILNFGKEHAHQKCLDGLPPEKKVPKYNPGDPTTWPWSGEADCDPRYQKMREAELLALYKHMWKRVWPMYVGDTKALAGALAVFLATAFNKGYRKREEAYARMRVPMPFKIDDHDDIQQTIDRS